MWNVIVNLIQGTMQPQELKLDIQAFGEAVQQVVTESIIRFYQIPTHAIRDRPELDGIIHVEKTIRGLSSGIPVSHLWVELSSGMEKNTDYYIVRDRVIWKILVISRVLHTQFNLPRIEFPLMDAVQLQEMERIVRQYVQSKDIGSSQQERIQFILDIVQEPLLQVSTSEDGQVWVNDGGKPVKIVAWLFAHKKRERWFNRLVHHTACHVYFLCCKLRDIGEFSERVERTDGNFLGVENGAFFVYENKPEGCRRMKISPVRPFGDYSFRTSPSPDRIHFLAWLEQRLSSLLPLHQFRSIIGPLDHRLL